jgi:hypothetical protein
VQGNAIRLVALQHQVLTVFCQLETMERINCDGERGLHVCTPGRKQIDNRNGGGLGFIPFLRMKAWDLLAESGIGETRLEQVDALIALRQPQGWPRVSTAAVASALRSFLRYEKLPVGPKRENVQ